MFTCAIAKTVMPACDPTRLSARIPAAGRSPTVAAKYCGSCNPHYDAAAAVRKISSLAGVSIHHWNAAYLPDICILVKQCQSDCCPEPERFSNWCSLLVEKPEEVRRTAEKLKRLIARQDNL